MTISNSLELTRKQDELTDIRQRIRRNLELQRKLAAMHQVLDDKQKRLALEIALAERHFKFIKDPRQLTPLDADFVLAALSQFKG